MRIQNATATPPLVYRMEHKANAGMRIHDQRRKLNSSLQHWPEYLMWQWHTLKKGISNISFQGIFTRSSIRSQPGNCPRGEGRSQGPDCAARRLSNDGGASRRSVWCRGLLTLHFFQACRTLAGLVDPQNARAVEALGRTRPPAVPAVVGPQVACPFFR